MYILTLHTQKLKAVTPVRQSKAWRGLKTQCHGASGMFSAKEKCEGVGSKWNSIKNYFLLSFGFE